MWMYFLHVCVSIKIHCLLNTGLLPTCRNMCTHTRHTHMRTHTDTTLLHKLWCLTCRCVSLKGQEPGTCVRTLQGGTLGPAAGTCLPSPRDQHMDPPCIGPGSSHAFVPFPAALWGWGCGTQMAGRREKWMNCEASERAAAQHCSRHLAVTLQMHLINYDLLKKWSLGLCGMVQ